MPSRYPFTPYPDKSWFKLAFADEVPARDVTVVHYFGRTIVALRDLDDGTPRLLDGACPRHGDPLDQRDGDILRCRFDRPHEGVWIHDGATLAGDTQVKVWPTLERNHLVYVWHDVDGGQPTYEVPVIPEIDDDGWTGYNKLHWVVRTHIQEVAENAVDLPHFAFLHDYDYTPTPNHVETIGNKLIVDVTSKRKILWITRETDLHLEYTGMGCVIARVHSPDVDLTAHLTPTPVDDEHININLSIIFEKTGNRLKDWAIRTFVLRDIKKEFERDIMVWESKAFFDTPVLCAGDGPVGKVRRWARTFYPEVEGRHAVPGGSDALGSSTTRPGSMFELVGADR